jgi:hypothetical protein
MKVFCHHLYEYKKGLRDLVLHTTSATYEERISVKLLRNRIAHIIHRLENGNINVFFGNEACVRVLKLYSATGFLGHRFGVNTCAQGGRHERRGEGAGRSSGRGNAGRP